MARAPDVGAEEAEAKVSAFFMAEQGYKVLCPQCGGFVAKFKGTELVVELNCPRCHSVVTIEKTPDTTSVFATKTTVKPAK